MTIIGVIDAAASMAALIMAVAGVPGLACRTPLVRAAA